MSQSFSDTMRQSEKIRLDLIRTELEIAFTFVQIAQQSVDSPDKRKRNAQNARAAYEAVIHLAAEAVQSEELAEKLRMDLRALRQNLVDLGETDLRQPD